MRRQGLPDHGPLMDSASLRELAKHRGGIVVMTDGMDVLGQVTSLLKKNSYSVACTWLGQNVNCAVTGVRTNRTVDQETIEAIRMITGVLDVQQP